MKQPVYYVSALFDADKGLFDFREEGDFAVLVRDAKRRIEVQLTRVKNHLFPHSTASGVVPEYTLVVEPWEERDFFMSLNGIPYYQGPVVLESKDILSLCLHGSQQDDMPFEILSAEDYMEKQMQASWRDAEANRITQEQLDEARLAQLERKQRMLKAQERINEMIKWQNFYHYRYTISGDSSHSLDKETRDGILFHHDRRGREGVPRQMIVSHITVPDDLVLAAVSGKLSDPPNASMTGGPLTTKRPPVNDKVIEELRKRAFLLYPDDDSNDEEEEEAPPAAEVDQTMMTTSPWYTYYSDRDAFCTDRLQALAAQNEAPQDPLATEQSENLNKIIHIMDKIKQLDSLISGSRYA